MLSSCATASSLRRPDPIDDVPGEVGAGLHRLAVGAANVDGGRAVACDIDFYPAGLPLQPALLSIELSFSLAFRLAFTFTLCFSFAFSLALGVELALAFTLGERRRAHAERDAECGDRGCERERAAARLAVPIAGVLVVHFSLLVFGPITRSACGFPSQRVGQHLRASPLMATPAIAQTATKA